MRSKIVLALLGFGILWALKSPTGGIVFYNWVILFRPQDFVWLPLPNVVPIAFAVLVFSLALGLVKKKTKTKFNAGTFYLMMILSVVFFSTVFSSTRELAWEKFIEVLKIISPSILISLFISSEKKLRYTFYTFALSIGIWGAQAAVHGILSGGAVENMKIGGQMSERNDMAVGVIMTLPFCYYMGMNIQKEIVKYFFYLISFLLLICIVVSNSRGAVLGLACVLMAHFLRKGTNRYRNLIIMMIAVPLTIPFIPGFVIERMSTVEIGAEQTEGSAKSRLILMGAGIRGALDNPLLGVGPGCWKAHFHRYLNQEGPMGDGAYEPHSIWVKIGAELGFIGLGAYLLMFIGVVNRLRKIQKVCLESNNMKIYNYSYMLQLSLIGYLTAGSFLNQIFLEYLFLIVAASGGFFRLWNEQKLITA